MNQLPSTMVVFRGPGGLAMNSEGASHESRHSVQAIIATSLRSRNLMTARSLCRERP
jgi:hypothetical protein